MGFFDVELIDAELGGGDVRVFFRQGGWMGGHLAFEGEGEWWKGGRIRAGRGQDGKCGVPLLFVVVRGGSIAERGRGERGLGCLYHRGNVVGGLFGQEG